MLEPRNETRTPESLPLVQITSKTGINQSATVAAIIRRAQATRNK